MNRQEAPYPDALAELVTEFRRYAGPGGELRLYLHDDYDRGQGCKGLTLIILRTGPDSYHPDHNIGVNHLFAVPPAAYTKESWRHWLFDRIGDVELHERMEHMAFGADGQTAEEWDRPYRPNHGYGEDPYIVHDPTTEAARRTSFRNVLEDDGTGRSKVHDSTGPNPAGWSSP